MSAEPIYLRPFLQLEAEEKKRFSSFIHSLEEGRGTNEKLALYEDILSENEEALIYVFKPTRHDDVKTIARNELTTLPPRCVQKDHRVFQNILLRAIADHYQSCSQTVITNIYVLYVNAEFALTPNFVIQELLGNPGLSFVQQIMFTRALSESGEALRIDWDQFDLSSYPQLVPAYANFFKQDDPLKALRSFAYLEDDFTDRYSRFINNCLEDCLIKIVKKKMYDEYLARYDLLPLGIKFLIGQLIESNVNLNNFFYIEEEHRFAMEFASALQTNGISITRDLTNLANGD
nr:hypothetical protein [Mucilaginibacter sp. L294]